jgi:hypothetical protein
MICSLLSVNFQKGMGPEVLAVTKSVGATSSAEPSSSAEPCADTYTNGDGYTGGTIVVYDNLDQGEAPDHGCMYYVMCTICYCLVRFVFPVGLVIGVIAIILHILSH